MQRMYILYVDVNNKYAADGEILCPCGRYMQQYRTNHGRLPYLPLDHFLSIHGLIIILLLKLNYECRKDELFID